MSERGEWEIFEMEKIAVLEKKIKIIYKTNINNINITQSLKRYFIQFINERYQKYHDFYINSEKQNIVPNYIFLIAH